MGLKLYELLPDYRDRCPLCRGSDCAVRHGLYFRCLVDVEGRTYQRFPVARFRCRRRGPDQPRDVTFSVLPAGVVPRRRFSLVLMSRMVEVVVNGKRTLRRALDEVAAAGSRGEEALLLEELTPYRILLLFSAVYARLLSFPVGPGRVARSRPRGATSGPTDSRPAGRPASRLSTPAGDRLSSTLLPPPAVRPAPGARIPLRLACGLTPSALPESVECCFWPAFLTRLTTRSCQESILHTPG